MTTQIDRHYQEMRQHYATQGATELLPYIPGADTATPAELDAVRDYHARTAGIPECFDGIDNLDGWTDDPDLPAPLTYLVDMTPYLQQWWEAIDTLHVDLATAGQGDLSPVGQAALAPELAGWFRARQHLLLAIAHHAGASVPQPDQDGHGGMVWTSAGWPGHFGYHTAAQAEAAVHGNPVHP